MLPTVICCVTTPHVAVIRASRTSFRFVPSTRGSAAPQGGHDGATHAHRRPGMATQSRSQRCPSSRMPLLLYSNWISGASTGMPGRLARLERLANGRRIAGSRRNTHLSPSSTSSIMNWNDQRAEGSGRHQTSWTSGGGVSFTGHGRNDPGGSPAWRSQTWRCDRSCVAPDAGSGRRGRRAPGSGGQRAGQWPNLLRSTTSPRSATAARRLARETAVPRVQDDVQ